jgi:hypothetical protein
VHWYPLSVHRRVQKCVATGQLGGVEFVQTLNRGDGLPADEFFCTRQRVSPGGESVSSSCVTGLLSGVATQGSRKKKSSVPSWSAVHAANGPSPDQAANAEGTVAAITIATTTATRCTALREGMCAGRKDDSGREGYALSAQN